MFRECLPTLRPSLDSDVKASPPWRRRPGLRRGLSLLVLFGITCLAGVAGAQDAGPAAASTVDGMLQDPELAGPLKIVLLFALISFIPTLVLSMSSFTRIVVVLALLRQAVGIVQLPPSRVMVGLALFLTLFTMAPVLERVHAEALAPYQAGELDEMETLNAALQPMRGFMLHHTHEEDLGLFLSIMKEPRPRIAADVPTVALVPAFMLSELKTAFRMGALLFLPFLAIDLVVASILMSMGMMMLPPMTISLPLKIIVFVVVDGWGLVITSLAQSYVG